MTWSAVVKATGEGQAQVAYSDGARSFTEWTRHDGSALGLRQAVTARIAQFEAYDAKREIVPDLVIDTTPVPPKQPSRAELERHAWFEAMNKVHNLKHLFDLGSAHVSQMDIDAATNNWNNLKFDPAWIA